MKAKFLVALAVLAVAAVPASADTMCAAGNTCQVTLTQSNVSQLAGIVVTVTINNTGANTILSFQLTTNPLTNTALGIDQVGWNGGVISTSTGGSWGGKNAAAAKSSMDGFGAFNVQGSDPGGTGGITTAITFTLNGLVTNFPANASGNEFAVHVRFAGNAPGVGCSGFVGGQTGTSSNDSEPGCTPVPEPASLALFGTGLLGVAGLIRRRFLS